jgi:hypothetical protein
VRAEDEDDHVVLLALHGVDVPTHFSRSFVRTSLVGSSSPKNYEGIENGTRKRAHL